MDEVIETLYSLGNTTCPPTLITCNIVIDGLWKFTITWYDVSLIQMMLPIDAYFGGYVDQIWLKKLYNYLG